jgi:hypothetical protein
MTAKNKEPYQQAYYPPVPTGFVRHRLIRYMRLLLTSLPSGSTLTASGSSTSRS